MLVGSSGFGGASSAGSSSSKPSPRAVRSTSPSPISSSAASNSWASAANIEDGSGSAGSISIPRYFFRPVAAGISLPMITFSLRPSSRSILPSIAASVSTLVVSWNDAADRNDSVASDAFVIPRISGSNVACSFFAFARRAFARLEHRLVDELAREQRRVAGALDPHLLQHLPDDQLDVLVVDVDALRLVDLLHLADEVQLGRGRALQREQLGRGDRALVQRVAGLDDLAVRDEEPRPPREAVLLRRDRLAVLVQRRRHDGHLDRASASSTSILPRPRRASRHPSGCGPRRSRRPAGGRA